MEKRISTDGIKGFCPVSFVERLIMLKLDQDGMKNATVRAVEIKSPEAVPEKKEA